MFPFISSMIPLKKAIEAANATTNPRKCQISDIEATNIANPPTLGVGTSWNL